MHHAGAISKMGSVEEGTLVCDYEQEEKEHQHSLNSALVSFDHGGKHFNLIDTPGAPDFLGQAIGALPAAETVVIVISADKGVQTVTRRIRKIAAERKFPTMIVVNKIDDHLNDLEELVESIRETFGSECLCLNLPTPDGSDVVNLFEKTEGDVLFSNAADLHTAIVDQVVEVDEELMAVYLEKGEVSHEQLHDAFESSLRNGHLVPIMFCSAKTGVGIQDLVHDMEALCPCPVEGNPRPFMLKEGDDEAVEWHADPVPGKPAVAHVFKVTTDQFVGKLSLMRVHQGTVKHGQQMHVTGEKKNVRLAHIHKVIGKDHQEIQQAIPGDIVAVAKVEELVFNTVLTEDPAHANMRYRPLPMPRPMYGLSILAKSRGDEGKISSAMHKLIEEDPTFKVERVAATKETVAYGLGELHMRVILERMQHRFKLELDTHPPKIAYKETITALGEGHHRHKKQSGGAGQFGEVFLKVEPLTTNGDDEHDPTDKWWGRLEFVDDTVGGSIPKQYLPAIEKGVRQAMEDGAIAGYPMTGVRVRVYDGKYHPVDSKEVAFTKAGKRAFVDGVQNAKPVLLEPVCDVEITAPATSMGDIAADLAGKRGQVAGTVVLPGEMCLIEAKVPLAEMNAYSSRLKSMTAGQGAFTMDYSHDERTPPNVQADIIAAFSPEEEED
jgi:elongation factor G